MKRTAIVTAAVLALSLAVCAASMGALNGILDEAHALSTGVFVSMENGDVTAAREGLVALATLWDDHAALMETLCAHDDLHEVKSRIIQAEICIGYTDMEDFYSMVTLIGEGIEHIRDQEGLTWTNLL